MFAILRYQRRIIALNLATSTPSLLNHFITNGAKLIEYRNDR